MSLDKVVLVSIAVLGFLFGIYQFWDARKHRMTKEQKEDLDKRLGAVKEDIGKVRVKVEDMDEKVRVLELHQVPEAKIHAIMADRVQPIEDHLVRMEARTSEFYRDLSIELRQFSSETRAHLMDFGKKIEYIKGAYDGNKGRHSEDK
jgi:hypothetical protein